MNIDRLRTLVDEVWNNNHQFHFPVTQEIHDAVDEILAGLDSGVIRVAEKQNGIWVTHQWIKKAILLSFHLKKSVLLSSGLQHPVHGEYTWYDKARLKFTDWNNAKFDASSIRVLPGAFVRYSAYVAPRVVLMPCFINVGVRIDSGSMIDTWATVGSCAQIGKNVHISGGTGIGGVLEPLQANPVIIEDNCFIGARSEVAEGVIIEQGSVLSMGVYIGASTRIIDRVTGVVYRGKVPSWSVVVPGTISGGALPDGTQGPSLYCAVIVKKVDAKTRASTSINELLRDT